MQYLFLGQLYKITTLPFYYQCLIFQIEPTDDDPINHILRLRASLNWRTMLPRHGPGMREAMNNTNDKNPLKVYNFRRGVTALN